MRYSTEVDVDVDFEDIVEDTDDSELIKELEYRGYVVSKSITKGIYSIVDLPKYEIKELLQDQFELNHHTTDEELLSTIKSYLQ